MVENIKKSTNPVFLPYITIGNHQKQSGAPKSDQAKNKHLKIEKILFFHIKKKLDFSGILCFLKSIFRPQRVFGSVWKKNLRKTFSMRGFTFFLQKIKKICILRVTAPRNSLNPYRTYRCDKGTKRSACKGQGFFVVSVFFCF